MTDLTTEKTVEYRNIQRQYTENKTSTVSTSDHRALLISFTNFQVLKGLQTELSRERRELLTHNSSTVGGTVWDYL